MTQGYGEYFGFTEVETKELLEYYNLELTKEVKEHYDGYNFGGIKIYDPWSILNYAQDKTLVSYWVNTSDNGLIKKILKEVSEDIKEEIEKLVLGESISFTYDNSITFNDLDNNMKNEDVIFNLLLLSGYLTYDKSIKNNHNEMEEYYRIPNKGVKEEFIRIIRNITLGSISNKKINNFREAILNKDVKQIEEYINETLLSMSYYDRKEMFYHGYCLGLFTIFISEDYTIKSNRESGIGRYDLMIERKDKNVGIIIEIKLANTKEEMEEVALKGLNQIKEKEHYKELELDKIEKINAYSIVFYAKECIVR